MTTVIIYEAEYQYEQIKPLVFDLIEKLAGEKIKSGSRVLIKPNMLSAARPEDAVLTHPLIIKAAVEYVLQKGAHPRVSDSPAIGSFENILKQNGTANALQGLPVVCVPFRDTVSVDIGKPYGCIEMARDAVEADVIINLPKLKTHSQMLLTLAVKNMFGCIVGLKKPQWHMRAGADTMAFARLLVAIHQAVAPACSILDGILALEGDGPGKGGRPRKVGVLAGSDHSFALDMVVCKMVGVNYENVPTMKIARDERLIPSFNIDGTLPEVSGFQLPEGSRLIYGPKVLQSFLRRHMLASPVCEPSLCRMCEKCWTICPAEAIRDAKDQIEFDYDKCIRCYCCLEVCPFGALRSKETPGGRVVRRFIDAFS
jgi:uncharacterized protein (DUF362 family)/Pyruvate/2-oxoacid:ferredoxin oxidoreductase delta subunit